jgi:hypothetical protein
MEHFYIHGPIHCNYISEGTGMMENSCVEGEKSTGRKCM